MASLRRVEARPLRIIGGDVEKPQERRHEWFKGPVEREEAASHLLSSDPGVVSPLDPKIVSQELDDREVRCRLAVRHRDTLDGEAVLDAMRVGELVVQTRLPDSGLTDHRVDLASAVFHALERLRQLLEFRGPPDELGQSAGGRRGKA